MINPELACVVLSVGNPHELPDAVQSLLDQGEPIEIVVVNSDGGDATQALARWSEIRVIEFPQRLIALPTIASAIGSLIHAIAPADEGND